MKKLWIVGVVSIIIGAALTVGALAVADFDINKFTYGGKYMDKTRIIDDIPGTVRLNDENVRITVLPAKDDKITIRYEENDKYFYTIEEKSGVLEISSNRGKWRIISFDWSFHTPEVIIEIPKGYDGDLDIISDNSNLSLEGIDFKNLHSSISNGAVSVEEIKTSGECELISSNGKISVSDSSFSEGMSVQTSNSSIELEELDARGKEITAVTSNGKLTAEELYGDEINLKTSNAKIEISDISARILEAVTSNGKIDFDGVDVSEKILFKTSNAEVSGEILVDPRDYTINSYTTNASNNLLNNIGTANKSIDINTSNGAINVSFTEK